MARVEFTPGPWRIEVGGGHAYNRICGSESVQTNGWPEPRGGISNASYSDRICENLGDLSLPAPMANARLIAAAPDLLEALRNTLSLLKAFTSETDDIAKAAYDQAEAAIAKATGETP